MLMFEQSQRGRSPDAQPVALLRSTLPVGRRDDSGAVREHDAGFVKPAQVG